MIDYIPISRDVGRKTSALFEAVETASQARKQLGHACQDAKISEEIGEYLAAVGQAERTEDGAMRVQEEAADVILTMLGKLDALGWRYLEAKTQRLRQRLDSK